MRNKIMSSYSSYLVDSDQIQHHEGIKKVIDSFKIGNLYRIFWLHDIKKGYMDKSNRNSSLLYEEIDSAMVLLNKELTPKDVVMYLGSKKLVSETFHQVLLSDHVYWLEEREFYYLGLVVEEV